MLTHLYIENFVLLEKLDLEFQVGMTVITGETGAGKSIILDALSLVLGARADSDLVRIGAQKCEVIATFALNNHSEAIRWLADHALDIENNDCLLRRQLSAEGRSRCFINGQPVPLQSLRELGELLVNMHGQHENQRLLQRDSQRELLDAVAGHLSLVEEIKKLYAVWQHAQTQFQQRSQQLGEREQRLAFLQYQVQEFSGVDITSEEIAQLENNQRQLATAEERLQHYQQTLTLLEDEGGILSQLQQAIHYLPPTDMTINTLLETAQIQLQEATHELHQKMEVVEINPEKLQQAEKQLSKLYDLARKHRVKIDQLPALWQQLQQELQQVEKLDEDLSQLEKQIHEFSEKYLVVAKRLRKAREKAAGQLSQHIEKYLAQLGMPGGKCEIRIDPYEAQRFTAQGTERVEFLVSINPGQPLQPLAKVASGGELSRISLAIQAIAAEKQALPTLIFDEVDVGIGGGTAAIVGQLLQQLSQHAQVLCITHLPQVAAYGQKHLQVEKQVHQQQTMAQLRYLNEEERIQEIARMLGGLKITRQSVAHARELLGVE